METPKNRNEYRTTRNPTPRLSERKKKLFFAQVNNQQGSVEANNISNNNNINNVDDELDGILPLDIKLNGTPKSRNLEKLLRVGAGHRHQHRSSDSQDNENDEDQRYDGIKTGISMLSGESESDLDKQSNPSPTRRSLRLKLKNDSPGNDKENQHYHNRSHCKEDNNAEDQHLQELFNTSLTITNPKSPNHSFGSIDETSNEEYEGGEEDNAQAATSKAIAHKNAQKRLSQKDNNDDIDYLADNKDNEIKSPQKKIPKIVFSPSSSSSCSLSPPLEHVSSISTKSFYSHPSSNESPGHFKHQPKYHIVFQEKGTRGRRSLGLGGAGGVGTFGSHSSKSMINRGVYHKVKRIGKQLLDKPQSIDIDLILHNLRNEKLKKLITSKREQREQIEKIHKIFRQAENPIEMAKPLSVISLNDHKYSNNNNNDNQTNRNMSASKFTSLDIDNDFSDLEFEDEYITNTACIPNRESMLHVEPVIPLIKYDAISEPQTEPPLPNRKFFKSKRTNVMEVRILDNIKASVCNGKIQLVEQKQKRRSRPRTTWSNEFSDEQATVEAILKNLDDTAFGDLTLNTEDLKEETVPTAATSNSTADSKIDDPAVEDDIVAPLTTITDNHDVNDLESVAEVASSETSIDMNDDELDNQSEESKEYEEFRNRLPYQTTNPQVIEQQSLLLDFLISNHICTEENFEIFIANPEKHREEAARILNNLVVVLTEEQLEFRDRLPYKTSDPKIIEQQQNFLYFLMENDICDEEHFDIFIANYDKRQAEAEAIIAEIQAKDAKINEILFNDQDQPVQSQSQQKQTTTNAPKQFDSDEHEDEAMESEEGYHEKANFGQNRSLELPSIPLDQLHNNISNSRYSNSSFNSSHNSSTSSSGYINDNESTSPNVPEKAKPTKLFPIFYKDKRAKPMELPKSTRHTVARSRLWQGGFGANQLQIDAGQKQFGATQCKQCGLLYTMHEAEEEKIHREFHASLYILRFKGWIDEDIVAIYPEWGLDGRIIRLTNASYPKRKERLMEILKVVDKELGFASYILPDVFVAYLAVRKSQIVGVCLVQPLKEANKYLNIDGLDCCSLETYEAKCGISRIWVSPLNRRFHIGTKLISAVQFNTILGEDIPLSKLAFSAPTEMGRKFAQKITKMENFLVY